MDDDQQFCLRWNNHQSTLISVFDTLLENGTLVDCTLAAEGKFLKAHKVVLSACSPYFATLLSQQYDKHPIFILKDVKFQELRAMMDYMYRGEVNISQDQLAALLKAAESLQIKGLSDNRSSASSGSSAHQQQQQTQQQKQSDASASAKTLQPPVPASKASGLTIENKRPLKSELLESDVSGSREGSTSPTRKRKKVRRRSVDTNNLLIDNHDQHSNSSSHSIHTASGAAGAATAGAAVGGATGAAAASAGASSLSSSSAAVGGGAASGAAAAGSNAAVNVLSAAAVTAAAAIKKTETAQQAAAAAELMKLQLQKQQIAAAAAAAAAAASAQSSDDEERCGGPSSVATGTEHDDGNELTDNEHDGDGGSSVKSGARHHREGGRRGNKTSTSTVGDLLIEPKSEYEDGQDENIEDLTMDDEELMDELDQAGPSHGGDVSSQGYAQWPLDREQNEAFIAAQDAVGGQHRDAQDILPLKTTTTTSAILKGAGGVPALAPASTTAIVGKRITSSPGGGGISGGTAIVTNAGGSPTTISIMKMDAGPNRSGAPELVPSSNSLRGSDGASINMSGKKLVSVTQGKPLGHPRIKYSRLKNPFQSSITAGTGSSTSSTVSLPILTIPTVTPSSGAVLQEVRLPARVQDVPTSTTTVAVSERQLLNFSLSRKLGGVQQHPQQHVTIAAGGGGGPAGLTAISAIQQIPIAAALGRGNSVTRYTAVNEYETSGSNTSQSADFPPGMIDDLDYSVIDDMDLSDEVQTNFSNAVAAAAAASEAATNLTSAQQQQQQQHQTVALVATGKASPSDLDNNGSQSDDEDEDGDQDMKDDMYDDDDDLSQKGGKGRKSDSSASGGSKLLNTAVGDSKYALLANTNIMTKFEYTVNDSSMVSDTDDGEVRQYVCRHCGKRYRWKSTLRRHENVECGGKEASHQCPYCSYKAKQRGNLGVHIRKHHADMPQLESRRKSNKSRDSM
ncbi:longitudinals lacking protein-like isoform X2 [Anopheles ziemanni]|uniref:longitudinals lacking protein-like isoform X2 n=1 Tax=Anopheles coustani TaxID=139045 RepID=UPI002658F97A|nr:longitudinals lacking protein-like isoform X2 [Anopheles coustani]XP_058167878.1 longitudinals lacking protein-like isoform X2 [Anopheles ziemanni]